MRVRACKSFGLTLAGSLIVLSGCSSAVKQVYYEFRGAKATIHAVREVDRGVFAPYKSLSFAPATTQSGEDICSPSLLREYDIAARNVIETLADVYPGGPPTLQITSDLLFFQEEGIFGAAEVLTRVRMADGERTIFECLVKSESKAISKSGHDDLSQACAKALGDFLVEQKQETATEDSDD